MELVRENEDVGANEDPDNDNAYRRGENQIPPASPVFDKNLAQKNGARACD
jgi:hypothetical protein